MMWLPAGVARRFRRSTPEGPRRIATSRAMRATASAAARPVPAVRAAARTGRAARRTRATMAGASPPAPRRWVGPRTGNLATLALEHAADVADDAPLANGFVRVDVHAIGLNFADVFTCLGLYAAAPKGVPYTPGLECCGVVTSVGQGVAGDGAPKVGDRVMCVTRFGGFAERIDLPWQQALPLPDTWSFEEGAAFPVQAITALYAMDLGGIADGARNAARATPPIVLVHSAAGGTGLAACHIAKRVHARAIMTVGTERKVEFLQSTFPHAEARDIIVRTSARDFPAQLQSAAPDGIDAALDSLGGEVRGENHGRLQSPCVRLAQSHQLCRLAVNFELTRASAVPHECSTSGPSTTPWRRAGDMSCLGPPTGRRKVTRSVCGAGSGWPGAPSCASRRSRQWICPDTTRVCWDSI